jgi:3',5'-cyclic AMP phosphodiesterase CpdA
VRVTRPDHMVLTGDLTHLGLPSEFLKAREWLQSLGPPSRVTVIPGNHDAYIATPWESTFCHWSDYMSSDADCGSMGEGKDLQSVFPLLRLLNGIALIGVSTARPTPLFSATGRIGKMQMERLENILAETRRSHLLRIIAIHHPPVPGASSWRKRLTDLSRFRSLLVRQGAELILHGHTHHTLLGHLETPFGKVSSIGVPSASALGRTAERRARYHLFRLIQNADGLDLLFSVRAYSSTQRCFCQESRQRLTLPQLIR